MARRVRSEPRILPPWPTVERMLRRRGLSDASVKKEQDELPDGRVYRRWRVYVDGQPIGAIFYNGRQSGAFWQGSNVAYTRERWGQKDGVLS